MSGPNPLDHSWWIASRSLGIVALGLITISVGVGLTMAGRDFRRPGLNRLMMAMHEYTSLAAIVAMAAHAITSIGDPFLKPGLPGIFVPGAIKHEPFYSGLGIVGFYMAIVLGLTFYFRNRIGVQLWRKAHRLIIVVYALAVVHTIGGGTDASTPWLRSWMIGTGAPILFLFLMRILKRPMGAAEQASAATPAAAPPRPISAPAPAEPVAVAAPAAPPAAPAPPALNLPDPLPAELTAARMEQKQQPDAELEPQTSTPTTTTTKLRMGWPTNTEATHER